MGGLLERRRHRNVRVLIGLSGAEFRLPLLIGVFRFAALEAMILNKAMSLIVVAFALPFRVQTVPFANFISHWPVIVDLLAGSLLGAWLGAGWATRMFCRPAYGHRSGAAPRTKPGSRTCPAH